MRRRPSFHFNQPTNNDKNDIRNLETEKYFLLHAIIFEERATYYTMSYIDPPHRTHPPSSSGYNLIADVKLLKSKMK